MRRVLVFALCVSSSAAAETRYFVSEGRAIPTTSSASRDAPVVEYAYGPRAYGSLGLAPGLLASDGFHLGISGLFAWENDDSSSVLPKGLLFRDVESLSASFDWPETWELTLCLGHEGAHQERGASVDPYRTTDIPFGAGGFFVGEELALELWPSSDVRFVSRVGERIFLNAFPLWVGQREASDHVADLLGEGLIHAPFAAIELRYRATPSIQPLASVVGEALVAHDDSARDGVLVRSIVGAAFPGRDWELVPFVSTEAGNGKGLFVNRRELRLSVGVRVAPRGGEP